jgi:hypothetical protein
MALGARLQIWSSCFYCATWFVFLGERRKNGKMNFGRGFESMGYITW